MDENLETMLANEEKNVIERISHLEKRVQQQDDEIICLKSTLADSLRRLQQLETALRTQQQQLNSQTSINTSSRTVSAKITRAPIDKSNQNTQLLNTNLSQKSNSKTNLNDKPSVTAKKSTTSATSSSSSTTTTTAPTPTQSNQIDNQQTKLKDNNLLSYNSNTNSIKLNLRGRAITTHVSNTIENFDFNQKLKAPKQRLKLDWVYGYRGKDCRSNVYQLPTGEILYFIAATVVLYNPDERIQRHYRAHTDDVKCIALNPDTLTIASGQTAGHDKQEGKPHVRIWDSVSLNTISIIGLKDASFQHSICCLAFSKSDGGKQLCVIDDGPEKHISIWDWRNCTRLISTKCYNDFVFAAEYHPIEKDLIVTCGKQHVFFWTFDGTNLIKKAGIFEKIEKPKYILCLAFIKQNGEIITGDSEGNLLIWNCKTYKITNIIKDAHEGGVFSIHPIMQNNTISMISGGGKDGKLIEWTNDYEKSGRILQIPELNGACRCITNGKGSLILIGTTKNCILQGNFDMNLNCIVNGHTEELWGLSINQRESYFLTCGNDRTLIYWDILTHSSLWSLQLDEQQGAGIHCSDIHPVHNLAAIGFTKPKWSIFDLNERTIVYNQIEGTEQIECIQYSCDGHYLACGSRDNSIYVYSVSDDGLKYSRIGRLQGHSSFITHLDWSSNNEYLMSNSGDYEILYWQIPACKQMTNTDEIRDINWSTNNCVLSSNTISIWNAIDAETSQPQQQQPPQKQSSDGTDINNGCVSNSRQLYAFADDFGKVNLVTYPCVASKAEKRSYIGHSSHVTNVKFANNDTKLISIGGNDMAVFEWSVIDE